jgi:hypothetical protein
MSLMSSPCEVSSIARAQRNTMSQSRLNLVERLSPAVLRGLQDSVIELTAEHPDNADYSRIVIGARLEKKLKTSMASAIKVHGLRKSLSDGPHSGVYSGVCSGVFVPYQDHLDLLAPGLAEEIKQGRVDLVDLANGLNGANLGTRHLPGYLVEDLLADVNDGNLQVPYNRMLPYSAKCLNASFWGVNPSKITGDRARGMPVGDFWKALCPPYGTHDAPHDAPHGARFNLATAILTMRKAGSAPFVQNLDDTFYFEHPNNTVGMDKHRFSFSGPAFMGLKHIAEIWNGLVHTVHGNPVDGSAEHAALQSLLYTEVDVGATLSAISLALLHDVDCRNAKQAEMFFSGRDCCVQGCEKSRKLKQPVCHLNTQDAKECCIRMMAEFKEQPFDSAIQDKDEQRNRQAQADGLHICNGESTTWGHAKDQIVKHRFSNSAFGAPRRERDNRNSTRASQVSTRSASARDGTSWRKSHQR